MRIIDGAKQRWRTLKAEHPTARHAVSAWTRLGDSNGGLYAGAITYFSFLALFPMLLLAVAVAGFVLHSHPAALQTLFDKITTNVPGQVGETLSTSIRTAIDARAGVGIVGLVGVLFTGLGWIGNLRAAIDAVWQRRPAARPFLRAKLANLAVLAGLGFGILVSLGLTAGWTAFSDRILAWLHLDGTPGMGLLLAVAGIAVAVAGDAVVFFWLLVRLPAAGVPRPIGVRGALLAAAGFEVLKIVGTITVQNTATSPTAGPFAGLVAVLVWIQLVVRWLLYCVAVTAVLVEDANPTLPPVVPESVQPEPAHALSPAAVGATLVGAGAIAGAAVTALAARRAQHERG